MTRLNCKTALITGSTDGVGRLVAKRFGEAGARVLVHGRNRERGERLVAEIKEGGGAAEFLAEDLSALAEVRRLAEAIQQRAGRLDILGIIYLTERARWHTMAFVAQDRTHDEPHRSDLS
jgi:NAD(P)-dependent dehydrogenase (short-subunit alcohol dehydrogenase family)